MADEVINGSEVLIFISPSSGTTTWTVLGAATSHTLSIKRATRVTSNKGSGDLETRAAGRADISGSLEGMYVDNDKYNLEDLQKLIIAGDPIMMFFGKENTSHAPDTTTSGASHFYASGLFHLTSVDATFPDQANSTFSATFEHAEGFEINKLYVS